MIGSRQSRFEFIPSQNFVEGSERSDSAYLIVQVDEDGHIFIQGSHEEMEIFLQQCADAGISLEFDCLSWCG